MLKELPSELQRLYQGLLKLNLSPKSALAHVRRITDSNLNIQPAASVRDDRRQSSEINGKK